MSDEHKKVSTTSLNIIENHNLLYYHIPKEIAEKMRLNEKEMLEYDVREDQFYCRKKGTLDKPNSEDKTVFAGLKVERTITRNNTILRTNLPKEVAQPLSIRKGAPPAILPTRPNIRVGQV